MSRRRSRPGRSARPAEPTPEPRLYLLTPPWRDPADIAGPLAAALGSADFACVRAGAESADAQGLAALIGLARLHGAALLIPDDVGLARAAGADGVHVRGPEAALDTAIAALKPDMIVGAHGGRSRHDAMTAGEKDIDYVMFGDPAPDGYTPPLAETLERVAWWADIFNAPCVAYAPTLEAVAPLAAAGADFVALGVAIWQDPRGPAAAARQAHELLGASALA